MVINNIDIDSENNLLICSTDIGITLYSFSSNEISKIQEYKIIEGCKSSKLIKTNKVSSNILEGIYLPKNSDTEFCMVELCLPSFSNDNINEFDVNENINNYDYQNRTPITKHYVKSRVDLKTSIYNIFITNDNIIVVTERQIKILGKTTFNILNIINTHSNVRNGLCLVSTKNDLRVYTLGTRCGEIVIVSPNINDPDSVKCHDHEIQCITTDIGEKYMATASINGTIINVFDLNTNQKIFQFRRGTSSAIIHSLAISNDLKWLACCSYSSKGTLHIFKLETDNSNDNNKKKISNTTTFLNKMFADYTQTYLAKDSYINASWSARQYDLNSYVHHTCKFDSSGILHVASLDGKYFKILTPSNEYLYMSSAKNLCVMD